MEFNCHIPATVGTPHHTDPGCSLHTHPLVGERDQVRLIPQVQGPAVPGPEPGCTRTSPGDLGLVGNSRNSLVGVVAAAAGVPVGEGVVRVVVGAVGLGIGWCMVGGVLAGDTRLAGAGIAGHILVLVRRAVDLLTKTNNNNLELNIHEI